jgi:hypothetical protein
MGGFKQVDEGHGVRYNKFNPTDSMGGNNLKRTNIIGLLSGFLVFVVLGACGPLAPAELSEEDFAATVDAMVAATFTAEANLAATVDVAVEATKVAEPELTTTASAAVAATSPAEADLTATASAAPQEQPPVVPTEAPPTPTVDTSTLSEEELAALIDAAVAEAVTATEAATTAMDAVASDGTITVEETVTVEVVLVGAEEAVALAEALIVTYYDLYGAYASETLGTLEEVEEDLNTIAEGVELMLQMLEQGSEVASAALEQIQAAVGVANASAAEIRAQSDGWFEALQIELDNRAAAALAVQATEIATDRQGAIQSAFAYVETVRAALADSVISQGELSAIALAGANASAGLKAQGGPQLQNLAGSIDALTAQIARGELPQAKGSLGALESSVPRRP